MRTTIPVPGLRPSRSLRNLAAPVLLALAALTAAAPAQAAADVNKAALEELRTVKGVGPGIAGRILEERKKGSYRDWPDFIARVKGIGDGNAAKFSANGLTVNGAAFSAVSAGAAAPSAALPKEAKGSGKGGKP